MSSDQSHTATSSGALLHGRSTAITGYSADETKHIQSFLTRYGSGYSPGLKGYTEVFIVKSLIGADRIKIESALQYSKLVYRGELVEYLEKEERKGRLNPKGLKAKNFKRFLIRLEDLDHAAADSSEDTDGTTNTARGVPFANLSRTALDSPFPISTSVFQGTASATPFAPRPTPFAATPTASRSAPITATPTASRLAPVTVATSGGNIGKAAVSISGGLLGKESKAQAGMTGRKQQLASEGKGQTFWYTVRETEFNKILDAKSLGKRMEIDEFCENYGVSEHVQEVLTVNDLRHSYQLSDYSFELYRKPKEADGLGLSIGEAQMLWKAVCAWKSGRDSIEDFEAE